jgi:hypothetical protein
MLTYRTGTAGREMAEHLLQQTLPPEMAVMAEYYEQGVTPPTLADAAASRYLHLTKNGLLPTGGALDAIVQTEAFRIGESALNRDGAAVSSAELSERALAAFIGAGIVEREDALFSLSRLFGSAEESRLDQLTAESTKVRDRSSATATPRRDMNPALARRLGITPNAGLKLDELSYLLSGQRADGRAIEGKRQKKDAPPVGAVFGLASDVRPTRVQLERILAGRTIDGVNLPGDQAVRAVRRFTKAMGAKAPVISADQRDHILAGRMADGTALSDREYKAVLDQGASRVGYIDFTFSAPKSLSVAWAFAPTNAERAMLHQAHTDAIESVLRTIEAEIGRARKGNGGKDGFEPGEIAWVMFDHYAARPTVEIVRQDNQGRPVTELFQITGTTGRVPGDMQVHTHVAVFNVVETASGRVGGLDLAQLDGRIHEWGALYQAFLATNLRKHGVDVGLDSKTEMARLRAVPESVVAQFSKRTNSGTDAARAYAETQGLVWDAMDPEHRIALLKSGVQNPREAKSDDVSDIATWRATAQSIGYNHRSVLRPDEVAPAVSREQRLEAAYHAALPLLGKQFEQRAVIDGSHARIAAVKGLIVAGVEAAEDVNMITRAFRERGIKRRGKDAGLVWGTVPGSQGREKVAITTTLEEREERILVETARTGARDNSAALSRAKIDAAIGAFPGIDFTSDHGRAQRTTLEKLGMGGRVALAIGVAGSGKSTLLKPLVRAWEDDGRTVYGMALAWRQSDDLVDAGIAKANTRAVDPFLNAVAKEKIQLDRNSVVVVDEVGLLGTRQLNTILAAQKKSGFQLVMIGDPKQMQSVEAGPVIALLRRALGEDAVPELGTSVRQKDADERETTLMFRNGQTAEAIARKNSNGTLHVAPGGYRDAVGFVADLWHRRRSENTATPGFTISVSAPTNAEAHDISMAIRDRRRTMGEIGANKITIAATDGTSSRTYSMSLAEGDRVRFFRQTNASFKTGGFRGCIGRNGSVVEIVAFEKDGLLVRNQAGTEGSVTWKSLRHEKSGAVQLAYGDALTTNTAQGSTVTEHIHAMPSGTRLVSAFGAYTSGSRHREQSFIVTSEGAERSEIVDRRPLGDRRPVTRIDILDNMVRNLARQPEKESATSLIEKAANLRRGTVREVQKTLEPMERRAAADVPATNLVGRFLTRRLTRQLEDRLPGLSASLRRQGERVAHLTRAGGVMAERLVAAARRQSSGLQMDRDYWRHFRDTTPEPEQTPDQSHKRGRVR